jgi:thioredoxin 1
MSAVTLVNNCDEMKQLLADHDNVVVDFYAPWVPAAKQTAPHFEQLASTYADRGIIFAKLDVDENEECAEEYGVTTVPAFFFYTKRKKQIEVTGADTDQLTEAVRKFVDETAAKPTNQEVVAKSEKQTAEKPGENGTEKLQPNPSESISSSIGG